MMLDQQTLTTLSMSAGIGFPLLVGAITYGVTKQKADSATDAVEKLGDRLDKRLDKLADDITTIGRDVSEINGELNAMRNSK